MYPGPIQMPIERGVGNGKVRKVNIAGIGVTRSYLINGDVEYRSSEAGEVSDGPDR
jgi:hypothetical protein